MSGLDTGILSALRAKTSQKPMRRKAFEEMLDRAGNKELMPNERKLILKITRLTRLRLERVIPNRGNREWVEARV